MNAELRERPMSERVLSVLNDAKPNPVKADVLAAQAGVRRILLAPLMSELIKRGDAHLVGDDAYGLGRQPLVARAAASVPLLQPSALQTQKLANTLDDARKCVRCEADKDPLSGFYRNDKTQSGDAGVVHIHVEDLDAVIAWLESIARSAA